MSRPFLAATLASATLLAACGQSETPPTEEATVATADPAAQETSPAAGPAAYVGQNAGDGFFADAAVTGAIDKAVTDMETRTAIQQMEGPTMTVVERDGRISASQCENGNCADHNYAVHIDPASGDGEVCYFDMSENAQAQWFMADGTVQMRDGDCTVG